MVRVTACTNQKGGVGKTTTVINLAAFLALSGTRTLVIDLDPQGNATSGLGVDRRSVERSSYDALVDRVPIDRARDETAVEGLELLPSSPSLSGAEVELVGVAGRERRLTASLAELNGRYERVLIDCPPSLGLLTVNALTAADGVLIPIQTEYYALEGLSQLVNTIRRVREGLNPRLEIEGVLLTMYDARTNLSAQVASEVRRHMNGSGVRHGRAALASGSPRHRATAFRSPSTIPARAARTRIASSPARWPLVASMPARGPAPSGSAAASMRSFPGATDEAGCSRSRWTASSATPTSRARLRRGAARRAGRLDRGARRPAAGHRPRARGRRLSAHRRRATRACG